MKIGFDAKRAFFNSTGLGNYSRSLLRGMNTFFPDEKLILFTPNASKQPFYKDIMTWENTNVVMPQSNRFSAFWRSYQIPNFFEQEKIDIYHGLSAELPIGKRRTKTKYIVTVHDLIFERFPSLYPFFDRRIYRRKTKYACEKADRIIAISEQTKRDMVSFLGILEEKIEVVYQSCNAIFFNKSTEEQKIEIQRKYQLPNQFLLTVGTVEKRKNLEVILRSLVDLPEEIKLIVIGKKTKYQEEINRIIEMHQLQQRILFLETIPTNELPIFYQMASIFIYPSIFEGFGIPILESLCSGTPVIAAEGSSLEEVGGRYSLYFAPNDATGLAKNILELWENPELRTQLIENSSTHLKQFSQENFVRNTVGVYEKVRLIG